MVQIDSAANPFFFGPCSHQSSVKEAREKERSSHVKKRRPECITECVRSVHSPSWDFIAAKAVMASLPPHRPSSVEPLQVASVVAVHHARATSNSLPLMCVLVCTVCIRTVDKVFHNGDVISTNTPAMEKFC